MPIVVGALVMPWRLMTQEEQKAHERERIEEAKAHVKPLDTQFQPVLDRVVSPESDGVEMAGQVVDTTKYKYDRIKVRGPDGVARYSAGNKDAVAKSLMGASKDDLLKVATANRLAMEDHFKSRNSGHFRMIVGQALRNIIIKGGKIVIGGVWIKSLDQAVNYPKGYAEEAKGTTANPIRKAQPSANRIKA